MQQTAACSDAWSPLMFNVCIYLILYQCHHTVVWFQHVGFGLKCWCQYTHVWFDMLELYSSLHLHKVQDVVLGGRHWHWAWIHCQSHGIIIETASSALNCPCIQLLCMVMEMGRNTVPVGVVSNKGRKGVAHNVVHLLVVHTIVMEKGLLSSNLHHCHWICMLVIKHQTYHHCHCCYHQLCIVEFAFLVSNPHPDCWRLTPPSLNLPCHCWTCLCPMSML